MFACARSAAIMFTGKGFSGGYAIAFMDWLQCWRTRESMVRNAGGVRKLICTEHLGKKGVELTEKGVRDHLYSDSQERKQAAEALRAAREKRLP
eukprot:3461631-Rhodomonas_salina.1